MNEPKNVSRFLAVWDSEKNESADLPGSGGGGCPGFVELANGDIGIVGNFVEADTLQNQDGCRILVADNERYVVVPRSLFDDAVKRLTNS